MRSLRRVLVTSFIALVVLTPAVSFAQEPRSPFGNRPTEIVLDETTVYTPPAIQVEEFKLDTLPQQSPLQGTFSAYNGSAELVGDITYQLELVSPLPAAAPNQIVMDAADIYDRYFGTEVLTLLPNASKSVSFTYTPPVVPAGDYRLRLQLMTSDGRILGQHQLSLTLPGSAQSFVVLRPGTINLPEFADLTIPPLSGPNVPAGSSFGVRATATHQGTAAVTVTPTLTVHEFAPNRPIVDTIQGTPLPLAVGQSQSFEVPVTAVQKAGVYHGVLSLVNPDNQRLSTLAEYRWVVRGSGADILSARVAQLRTKQGEAVQVRVDYTGPSDAETATRGKLHIAVIDQQGTAGELLVPEELELSDQVVEGFASVPLSRDLVGTPGLKVTLTDVQGNVLDTYTVDLPLSADEIKQLTAKARAPLAKSTLIFFTLGSLLAIAIILYLLRQLKKPHFSPPTALLLVIALLTSLGVSAYAVSALAQNQPILVQDSQLAQQSVLCQQFEGWCRHHGKIIQVAMWQPAHSNPSGRIVRYPRNNIPFAFAVSFAGCNNATDTVKFTLRYDTTGALHQNLAGTSTSNWINLITDNPIPGQCGPQICQLNSSYTAPQNIHLGSLATTAETATLQLQALSARWASVPPHLRPQFPLVQGFGQVINTWVYLFPLDNTVPVDPVDPTTQCSDDIDNDNDGGRIDANDPACHVGRSFRQPYDPTLDSEVDPECSDNRDNDGNNDVDQQDPDCHTDGNATNENSYDPTDLSETGTTDPVDPAQCNDDRDNDNDLGRVDCDDPGCWRNRLDRTTCNRDDNDESDPQCSDNRDNDGDGVFDSNDPGCHTDAVTTDNDNSYNPEDNDETNTQCSDIIDNDRDSKHNCDDPGCRRTPGDINSCEPADNSEIDPAFDPGDIVETE